MKSVAQNHDLITLLIVFALGILPLNAFAGESLSPEVNQRYPTNVYWGDTHVHTKLSGDAYAMGARLTPDDAYRFAKGEAVIADSGEEARLRRPMDFLVVADHAESLGVMPRLDAGDESLLKTEAGKRMAQALRSFPVSLPEALNAETEDLFNQFNAAASAAKSGWKADYGVDYGFRRSVWEEVCANAERHNEPGTFTAFIGFEWSAAGKIHRNVIFEGGPDQASQVLPFSAMDSNDPKGLWAYLS
ncbi:MAG: DUF3604 domain-containing protein, partial [Planctomycetota bacterium]